MIHSITLKNPKNNIFLNKKRNLFSFIGYSKCLTLFISTQKKDIITQYLYINKTPKINRYKTILLINNSYPIRHFNTRLERQIIFTKENSQKETNYEIKNFLTRTQNLFYLRLAKNQNRLFLKNFKNPFLNKLTISIKLSRMGENLITNNYHLTLNNFNMENHIKKSEDLSTVNIAGALEHFRKKLNLSQREFAKKGGVSSTYYNDVINGIKNPTISKIDKFCRETSIPFHLLMHQALIEGIEDISLKSLALEELTPLIKSFNDSFDKLQSESRTKQTLTVAHNF